MPATKTPAAIVILTDNLAYMTVRDWRDKDGQAVIPGGVDRLENYFGDPDSARPFASIVDREMDVRLDEIVGNIVLSDKNATNPVPMEPTLCTFRITKDGDDFVCRWLTPLGSVGGQAFGFFALLDDSSDLLMAYYQAHDEFRASGTRGTIAYGDFVAADLTPVYRSVTIAKPVVTRLAPGGSDGGGDGWE